LNVLHRVFYHPLFARHYKSPDSRELIDAMKKSVFKGICFAFSGVFRVDADFERTREVRTARLYGADVSQDLSAQVTHLVAARLGTAKCIKAKEMGVEIVSAEWFWSAVTHFRVPESTEFGQTPVLFRKHQLSPDVLEANTLKIIFGESFARKRPLSEISLSEEKPHSPTLAQALDEAFDSFSDSQE